MKLYKIQDGVVLHRAKDYYILAHEWDSLINRDGLYTYLMKMAEKADKLSGETFTQLLKSELLPPIGQQEVWAAGVTYLRSREARMEESSQSGGAA